MKIAMNIFLTVLTVVACGVCLGIIWSTPTKPNTEVSWMKVAQRWEDTAAQWKLSSEANKQAADTYAGMLDMAIAAQKSTEETARKCFAQIDQMAETNSVLIKQNGKLLAELAALKGAKSP